MLGHLVCMKLDGGFLTSDLSLMRAKVVTVGGGIGKILKASVSEHSESGDCKKILF